MLILKKLGGFILSIIKSKWFWFILLVILLLFYINKNRNKNLEIERLNNNSIVLDQSIKKLTTKNGELYYSVNALTLKKDEFSDSNSVLNKQLKEMGIKLKNVQSINQMSISYIKNYDSIDSKPMVITDTVFINKLDNNGNINYFTKYSFENNSSDINISGVMNVPITYNKENKLTLIDRLLNPYLSDINIKVNDTLTVVPTINYKRVWIFFRRPKSVTVFIKSENKLFNLEQMKTYQITK